LTNEVYQFVFIFTSRTKVMLIVSSMVVMYTNNDSCVLGLHKTRAKARSFFNSLNLSWHVLSQTNLVDFFNNFIIGLVLLANLGKNRDIIVNLPISRCTSFILLRLFISIIAWHFSGLASRSLCVSINPRNLLLSTLNTHFSRFNRRL